MTEDEEEEEDKEEEEEDKEEQEQDERPWVFLWDQWRNLEIWIISYLIT